MVTSILKRRGSVSNQPKKHVRFEGIPEDAPEEPSTAAPDIASRRKSLEMSKGLVEGIKGIRKTSKERVDIQSKIWKNAEEVKSSQEKSDDFKSLGKLVDVLESGLSSCLSTYRHQAEELLQDHIRKLEDIQIRNELQIASLITENTLMRERLGLKPTEQLQSIMFQTIPSDNKKEKRSRGHLTSDDDDDRMGSKTKSKDDKMLNARKNGGKNQAPGGSWQPFVAWVPNGAALNNPEPWKPMPYQDIASANFSSGNERRGGRKKAKDTDNTLSILPGAIDNKEDSDSDGTTSTVEEKYELSEVWKPTEKMKKKMKGRGSVGGDGESSAPFREDVDEFAALKEKPFYIINPDSNMRIFWDIMSLFMVVYDMILIPLFVFTLPDNDLFLQFMDWTTRIFWNLDVGWSICTGYVRADGSVEYHPRAILKKYARTWFAMDMFIIISDWISLIVASDGLAVGKLARIFRVVRVARLLRLVRMQEIIAGIMERIHSDSILFFMQILKWVLLVIFISHVTGCGWWGINATLSDNSDTWTKVNGKLDDDLASQYMLSLDWALMQFGGGLAEVEAKTTLERFYQAAIFVVCFFTGLVMISTLTSNLTQQYIIGGSGARQLATLKKYLKQNNVPKNLAKRLCRNANHAISGDLTSDSVELLSVISEPLMIEMHFEIYSRMLSWHPFLNDLLCQGNPIMRPVCHRAMSMLLLASSDVVFSIGEEPNDPKMYIVVSGTLSYNDMYGENIEVTERQYLSEACLWTNWRHKGTLTATSDVKMTLLDATSFQDICKRGMRKDSAAALVLLQYASDYMNDLNKNTGSSDLPEF